LRKEINRKKMIIENEKTPPTGHTPTWAPKSADLPYSFKISLATTPITKIVVEAEVLS